MSDRDTYDSVIEQSLSFVPVSEFERVREEISDPVAFCSVFADMCRINVLSMIREAGSGHPGTCLSLMEILSWLWTQEMENPNMKGGLLGGDVFFSSKGHDVPALYAVLIALGKIKEQYLHNLRRLHGLPGHPDIRTPYIAANTGSLGMGISKARGIALAKRLSRKRGNIFVVTGDGELQEGQIWESLQSTAAKKLGEITVIVDHNKMQSDAFVRNVSDLGDLEEKFRAFGWSVARCNGHDLHALRSVFRRFRELSDMPKVLIADTIKGKGVSFMKSSIWDENVPYRYHAGAPCFPEYQSAIGELTGAINERLSSLGLGALRFESDIFSQQSVPQNTQRLMKAYENKLAIIGEERADVVVLDADLAVDCGVETFRKKFPERFFECGIAEQDMVSMAGGLALAGKLPIVHSYACFLTMRADDQIYNNSSEGKKIIYVSSMSGLLPATPGHSHQGTGDIARMGSNPGLTVIQPCNEHETVLALQWAVYDNPGSTYLRLTGIPYELSYQLPEAYALENGKGVFLREGNDVVIIGYGPLMLSQAMKAAVILDEYGVSAAILNLPWLNCLDRVWFYRHIACGYPAIVSLDDHYLHGGQGSVIASALASYAEHPPLLQRGLRELPECGQPQEVLRHHRLDGDSLADIIRNEFLQ